MKLAIELNPDTPRSSLASFSRVDNTPSVSAGGVYFLNNRNHEVFPFSFTSKIQTENSYCRGHLAISTVRNCKHPSKQSPLCPTPDNGRPDTMETDQIVDWLRLSLTTFNPDDRDSSSLG